MILLFSLKMHLFTVLLLSLVASSWIPKIMACNKIACGLIIAGCAGVCACDFPACECCPLCMGCLGGMWSTCCDCFGKCDALAKYHSLQMKRNVSEYTNDKISSGSFDDQPELQANQIIKRAPPHNSTTVSSNECYYGTGKYSIGATPPGTCMICCGGGFCHCRMTKYGCSCGLGVCHSCTYIHIGSEV